MFCRMCGEENPENARFCKKCGTEMSDRADSICETEDAIQENSDFLQSQNRRKQILIGAAIILAVIIICVVSLVLYHQQKEKRYNGKLETAAKYLQELDYEKAETAYLDAIEIDPKKEDTYLQLADLYIKQGQKEKAIKILKSGSKKTSSKQLDEQLTAMLSEKSTEDFYSYLKKTFIPENGLADLGSFVENKTNKLGLISAWIQDVNDDGSQEMITTSLNTYNTSDLQILLFQSQDGNVVQVDGIEPEVYDATVTYGDSATEVFIKNHEGKFYLVVYSMGTNQSYSNFSTKLDVYSIGKKFKKEREVTYTCYSGDLQLSVNGNSVFKLDMEDSIDLSQEEMTQKSKEGIDAVQRELRSYGLESKIRAVTSFDITGPVEISGYDESEKTEVYVSDCERIQNGQYDDFNEVPVMKLLVDDGTKLRTRLYGSNAEPIKPVKMSECLNMSRSRIEDTYGELSDSSVYFEGGNGYLFKKGYEGIRIYFPAITDMSEEDVLCTGIDGPAGKLLDGITDSVTSVSDFEKRSGVSLENGQDGTEFTSTDYYGEFSDGTRIFLYNVQNGIKTDTIIRMLPSVDLF